MPIDEAVLAGFEGRIAQVSMEDGADPSITGVVVETPSHESRARFGLVWAFPEYRSLLGDIDPNDFDPCILENLLSHQSSVFSKLVPFYLNLNSGRILRIEDEGNKVNILMIRGSGGPYHNEDDGHRAALILLDNALI